MGKKYHLLYVIAAGSHVNTFIEGSVPAWVTKNRGKKIVVINSWPATKAEYMEFKDEK